MPAARLGGVSSPKSSCTRTVKRRTVFRGVIDGHAAARGRVEMGLGAGDPSPRACQGQEDVERIAQMLGADLGKGGEAE